MTSRIDHLLLALTVAECQISVNPSGFFRQTVAGMELYGGVRVRQFRHFFSRYYSVELIALHALSTSVAPALFKHDDPWCLRIVGWFRRQWYSARTAGFGH